MKKMLLWMLSAVLLLAALPVSLAEEDVEMVPVLAQVPDGWENPHLWAWSDDGANAFEAWPGEAMQPLGESGWYYAYVPGFVQNAIVSANDAAVQTEGVVIEAGKAAWIAIADDLSCTVSYEAQADEAIPEYVETFTVHAYVPLAWETVNLWAWSAPDGTNAFAAWPGEAMSGGEDGWFTAEAPTWVNSIIVSGNEGEAQTEDIAIEAKEVWVTVYNDLTYEVAYEDPEQADVPDITIHAQVPADWAEPCCWAWSAPDGTNAYAAWPGEAMAEEDGWYTAQAPGWINSVIINGNAGSVQTADLSVESGVDVWVVVTDAENASVTYEAP